MNIKIRSNFICAFVCLLVLIAGCKKEKELVGDEPVKNINGSWKIVKLTRNGEDLTQRVDLSKFRIVFNADNSYTLVDQMAFVVQEPGTYKLDDPQYPFGLILTPKSTTDTANIAFQFPIAGGKRQLSLTMSFGCKTNVYQYLFEKQL